MRRPCSNGWNLPFRSNFGIRDVTVARVPAESHLYPPLIGGVELSGPFDPAKILPIIAESRTTQLVLDSAC
jgi:hypothetical protein